MKRRQLFEFTDLPWWPKLLRSLLTDFLEGFMQTAELFSPQSTLLASVAKKTGHHRFIDLCSGSGGPWLSLHKELQELCGNDLSICLTDKYPNDKQSSRWHDIVGMSYLPYSVDALAVPDNLQGIRTIFNGFHHFPPELAATILRDAVRTNQPIAIFEALQRTWFDLFLFTLTPIHLLLRTPWVYPRRFSRFLFTYILPIAPILTLWDGVVSILRCYTPEELLAMAKETGASHYVWKAGCYRVKGLPVTFMVGYPATTSLSQITNEPHGLIADGGS